MTFSTALFVLASTATLLAPFVLVEASQDDGYQALRKLMKGSKASQAMNYKPSPMPYDSGKGGYESNSGKGNGHYDSRGGKGKGLSDGGKGKGYSDSSGSSKSSKGKHYWWTGKGVSSEDSSESSSENAGKGYYMSKGMGKGKGKGSDYGKGKGSIPTSKPVTSTEPTTDETTSATEAFTSSTEATTTTGDISTTGDASSLTETGTTSSTTIDGQGSTTPGGTDASTSTEGGTGTASTTTGGQSSSAPGGTDISTATTGPGTTPTTVEPGTASTTIGGQSSTAPGGTDISTATTGPGATSTSIGPGTTSATGTGTTNPRTFDIDLEFADGFPPEAILAFEQAKTRWESIITTDIADVPASDLNSGSCFPGGQLFPDVIDDVYICSEIADLNGTTIGQARVVERRDGPNGLPVLGRMTFDPDFVNNTRFIDTVLHEMAHVLGIGTLWPVTDPPLADSDTPPCAYAAEALASIEYQNLSGCLGPIPLENSTGREGSDCSHWGETCFGTELMTPTISSDISNPISILTIGSLQDLGYQVERSQADPFLASQLDPSCNCNTAETSTFTKEPQTPEQEEAYLAAYEYAKSQLVAPSQTPGGEDVATYSDWISVLYLDPVTDDIHSIIVTQADV